MVLVIKNLPASAGDVRDKGLIPGLGRSLDWEDPLEEGMATHIVIHGNSSILVWRIPQTEKGVVHRVAEADTTEVT